VLFRYPTLVRFPYPRHRAAGSAPQSGRSRIMRLVGKSARERRWVPVCANGIHGPDLAGDSHAKHHRRQLVDLDRDHLIGMPTRSQGRGSPTRTSRRTPSRTPFYIRERPRLFAVARFRSCRNRMPRDLRQKAARRLLAARLPTSLRGRKRL